MIRQAAKGTGYDNEDARELLREAGVQAFRKQAGYVPAVDDKEIDPLWITLHCLVPYRRDWRKELFDSVHYMAVPQLTTAFHNFLKTHKAGIRYKQAETFVRFIVKQNRKFVDHEAA